MGQYLQCRGGSSRRATGRLLKGEWRQGFIPFHDCFISFRPHHSAGIRKIIYGASGLRHIIPESQQDGYVSKAHCHTSFHIVHAIPGNTTSDSLHRSSFSVCPSAIHRYRVSHPNFPFRAKWRQAPFCEYVYAAMYSGPTKSLRFQNEFILAAATVEHRR